MTKRKYFATGAFPLVDNVVTSSSSSSPGATTISEIAIRYRLNLFVNNFMVSLTYINLFEVLNWYVFLVEKCGWTFTEKIVTHVEDLICFLSPRFPT